jgi:hypothetical protein
MNDIGGALGQVATEAKSTEIRAIPALLCQLELEGAEVTIDAMGYQQAIAEQIIAQKGDYVRALKGNQSILDDAVRDFFVSAKAHDFHGLMSPMTNNSTPAMAASRNAVVGPVPT